MQNATTLDSLTSQAKLPGINLRALFPVFFTAHTIASTETSVLGKHSGLTLWSLPLMGAEDGGGGSEEGEEQFVVAHH